MVVSRNKKVMIRQLTGTYLSNFRKIIPIPPATSEKLAYRKGLTCPDTDEEASSIAWLSSKVELKSYTQCWRFWSIKVIKVKVIERSRSTFHASTESSCPKQHCVQVWKKKWPQNKKVILNDDVFRYLSDQGQGQFKVKVKMSCLNGKLSSQATLCASMKEMGHQIKQYAQCWPFYVFKWPRSRSFQGQG